MLTIHHHHMEAYYALETVRKYEHLETLRSWSCWSELLSDAYPKDAANAFTDAFCVSEGHRFFSALPLVETVLFPNMWRNLNVPAEIAPTFSAPPATFLNVTVTSTTTITSFCATVNQTSLLHNESLLSDLSTLCRGCAALSGFDPIKSNALERWIHATCPINVPKPTGVYCVRTTDCIGKKNGRVSSTCSMTAFFHYSTSYLNPSFDACFGHTLMSAARMYIVAVAIASDALAAFLLLLCVRLWVLCGVAKARKAMAEAVPHTPA
ncbi:hypothetical protein SPRG_16404 [Saprolegnia parasitica CBS 223.65]|uniref:Uncharacterized protein n=1 Tax=Saprolegnia parasitica (strain CBS 223.65) TaxID=695850 RepID=A0A067BUB8_SAPPC|nr:hypothetical protein SPRG_16404 [Saprolegnia parasitica CBS 223.65]KDO18172.1 hypothetical protein SPRG_16404 [Saprolegnia parasitica CBS 223.65]|eukprot:XP_012211118.1 hypothetical protein SPRG_16404 [Saprolegnia parasitica CBS 223.65]